MVTKRRASATSTSELPKKLCATVERAPIHTFHGSSTSFAGVNPATYLDYSNKDDEHVVRRHLPPADDGTASTTSVDTAEPDPGKYAPHDDALVHSGCTCSLCDAENAPSTSSIAFQPMTFAERVPLDEISEMLTPHAYHSEGPEDTEEDDDDESQDIVRIIRPIHPSPIDESDGSDSRSPFSTPPHENIREGNSHTTASEYDTQSLESSPAVDARKYMTLVEDDEVPSSYVDFALFMMERGTILFQWVQNAKERLEALQMRLAVLESQEADHIALAVH